MLRAFPLPRGLSLPGGTIYKIAATPAATAPMTIMPLEMTFETAPLPVADALALDPVALAVDEPAVLELPESSVAAPKIPPWTVSGEEP